MATASFLDPRREDPRWHPFPRKDMAEMGGSIPPAGIPTVTIVPLTEEAQETKEWE